MTRLHEVWLLVVWLETGELWHDPNWT